MTHVKTHKVGIVMNGVTGRMGANQHLLRSIAALIQEGGVRLAEDEVILPDPVLVGRSPAKLQKLAARAGVEKWTTRLDQALDDPHNVLYFDAQTTQQRVASVTRAIEAGKHVYCEKPSAESAAEAVELYRLAQEAGVKHGVVQDKLWLPGLIKLKRLIDSGFFGRVLSVRGEFGYWVFEGDSVPAQRPSWNYRREEGGGIILDMFAHWRYVLDNLFGAVRSVCCLGATHVPQRWDEAGRPYPCTADDAAYAIFELDSGTIAQFNSSWTTRVRRDDLLTLHVDGTLGSAVCGLRHCWIQPAAATPRPVWNPDVDSPLDYLEGWTRLPDVESYANAFKAQWERFLRYVVTEDEPFPWDLLEGAKGVQLAELGLESWKRRAFVDVPPLCE
jgi:predicted dehydrogenase